MNALWRAIRILREAWAKTATISATLRTALYFALGAAVLGFLIGRATPEGRYQEMRSEMSDLREDLRVLAAEREVSRSELNRLRLSEELGEKMAGSLRQKIEELIAENLRIREKVVFYQNLLDTEPGPALNVYALDDTPDFEPNFRLFSAVLVLPGKDFSGSYYFQAVVDRGGDEQVLRAPTSGAVPLQFNTYTEISQRMEIPSGTQIKRLRLIVLGEEGEEALRADSPDFLAEAEDA